MFLGMLFCVFTVDAVAHTGTRHSLLEALAVLLLAMRLFTIAPFEMALALDTLLTLSQLRSTSCFDTTQGRDCVRDLQVSDVLRGWMNYLRLPKCLRVPHENMLLCIDPNFIESRQVIATSTRASCSTVPVIGKTLAVEFQTLWFATVAWFMSGWTCVNRWETLT